MAGAFSIPIIIFCLIIFVTKCSCAGFTWFVSQRNPIFSKKGNLQLIIEEFDAAIVSINKAIEMQRFSKDNANLGNSYKTFGDIYKSKNNYKQALDYYISAQTLFEQEGLNNNLSSVLLSEAETYIELKNYPIKFC